MNNKRFVHRQTGASTFVMLVMVLFFGGLLMLVGRLAPAYIDDLTVQKLMERLDENENPVAMTPVQLRNWVKKQLQVNNVDNFDASYVTMEKRGDVALITVEYEVRTDLFFNVDAVIQFRHEYEMRGE